MYSRIDWANGEVRMLRLLPSHNPLEPLRCTLETMRRTSTTSPVKRSSIFVRSNTDLEAWRRLWDMAGFATAREHGYIALSYEWGRSDEYDEILVDEETVRVKRNLADAFRAIRRKGYSPDGYRIWADSLCVDQRDTGEVNHHVSIMGNIYALADEVIVWLGDERDNSSLAIDLIYELAAASEHNKVGHVIERYGRGFDETHNGDGTWLALLDFTERSYWKRLWIIQELCLARRSSVVLCGDRAVPWFVIYEAIWNALYSHIDSAVHMIGREHQAIRGTPFFESHHDILNRSFFYHINLEKNLQSGNLEGLSRRNRENTKDGWHIMPILDCSRASSCLLDHDRIYGLFSLLPACIRQRFVPDYQLSVNKAYQGLARVWVETKKDLEILSQCSYHLDSDLPSWVPDWRYSDHIRLFKGANVPYRASLGLEAKVTFTEDGQTMLAEGFVIDEIDGLGSESSYTKGCDMGVLQSRTHNNAYRTDDGLRDALWRTLIGDITTSGHAASDEYHRLLLLVKAVIHGNIGVVSPNRDSIRLKQLKDRIVPSLTLKIAGQDLLSCISIFGTQTTDPTPSSDDKGMTLALEQAFRFSRLKRLATTASGRLAMVPDWTRQGDQVCILLGSDIPFVIRKRPEVSERDCHRIIGGCYVHGCMQGETMIEAERVGVETIRLM